MRLLGISLLAFPMTASAADSVGAFVHGGLALAAYEESDNIGNRLELEEGTGFHLTGGLRFAPGIMLRAAYTYSEHDGGESFSPFFGTREFDDQVELDEVRIGIFFSPAQERVVGFRAGAGYETVGFEIPSVAVADDTDGYFLEGGLLLRAGPVVTFDIGLAFMDLEDEEAAERTGAEFKAGALFHAGPVDIGLGYRLLSLTAEVEDFGYEYESDYGEARLTIGGNWGYASTRSAPQ